MCDQSALVTLNVQSLGRVSEGLRKRREIKELLPKTIPKPDVVLIQEHKYVLQECLTKTKHLDFLKGATLGNKASCSATEDLYKEGIGFLLSPEIAASITAHGIISPGRVQYITSQWSKDITSGIINVYAHNHTGPRARLWYTIWNCPLPPAQWIVAGDFNMVQKVLTTN